MRSLWMRFNEKWFEMCCTKKNANSTLAVLQWLDFLMDGQWQLHTPEKKNSFRSRNVRIYYATIDGWDNRMGETELTLSKSRFRINLLLMLQTISTAMFQRFSVTAVCFLSFLSIHIDDDVTSAMWTIPYYGRFYLHCHFAWRTHSRTTTPTTTTTPSSSLLSKRPWMK